MWKSWCIDFTWTQNSHRNNYLDANDKTLNHDMLAWFFMELEKLDVATMESLTQVPLEF